MGFGNTAEAAHDAVRGRRRRGVKTDGAYNRRTGAGYVSHKDGDYVRVRRRRPEGVECVPLLVETFGGLSPALTGVLREAADWRSNKLISSEYYPSTTRRRGRRAPG